MRRIVGQIEVLGAVPFIFLIGLVAGAIQGIPRMFLGGTSTPFRLVPYLIIGTTAVLWWLAALLLWWIAVRRRQSSLWVAALQVTTGLVLAELFAGALGMVAASIDSHGEMATIMAQHLSTAIVTNLGFTLLRSPLWFVGATLAIALGRHLSVATPP